MDSFYKFGSLSEQTRASFIEILGLKSLEFNYFDISGNALLRSMKYKNGECIPQIDRHFIPANLSDQSKIVRYLNRNLLKQTSVTALQQNHWAFLFPFPFAQVFTFLSGETSEDSFEITDRSFLAGLKQFADSWTGLVQKLLQAEISVLFLETNVGSLGLLFHSVRGKFIDVGTRTDIHFLIDEYKKGTLVPEKLMEIFQTRSAFFYLPIEMPEPSLSLVSSAIQAVREGPRTVLSPDRPGAFSLEVSPL